MNCRGKIPLKECHTTIPSNTDKQTVIDSGVYRTSGHRLKSLVLYTSCLKCTWNLQCSAFTQISEYLV